MRERQRERERREKKREIDKERDREREKEREKGKEKWGQKERHKIYVSEREVTCKKLGESIFQFSKNLRLHESHISKIENYTHTYTYVRVTNVCVL